MGASISSPYKIEMVMGAAMEQGPFAENVPMWIRLIDGKE